MKNIIEIVGELCCNAKDSEMTGKPVDLMSVYIRIHTCSGSK